jgi:hypothetical protein
VVDDRAAAAAEGGERSVAPAFRPGATDLVLPSAATRDDTAARLLWGWRALLAVFFCVVCTKNFVGG